MILKTIFCIFLLFEINNEAVAKNANGDADPKDIAQEKCQEYSKFVADSNDCPFSYSEDLTEGNFFSTRKEFPHMALVGYKEEEKINWLCAASLISDQFLLTAGHCLKPRNLPTVVKLGVTDLNDTDNLQEIKIEKTITHPEYHPPSAYNDIGLIKLEKKVDINSYLRPACLLTETKTRIYKAINSGWGSTYFAGPFDERLQKVVLEIYNETRCKEIFKNHSRKLKNGITYETMICAGTRELLTIQPTTGGPLQVYHKEQVGDFKCMYDITGVASFGKIPGIENDAPDVYTRVSPFISWIVENVWK